MPRNHSSLKKARTLDPQIEIDEIDQKLARILELKDEKIAKYNRILMNEKKNLSPLNVKEEKIELEKKREETKNMLQEKLLILEGI